MIGTDTETGWTDDDIWMLPIQLAFCFVLFLLVDDISPLGLD